VVPRPTTMNRVQVCLLSSLVLCIGACLPSLNIPGVKRLTAPKPDPDQVEFREKHCSTGSGHSQPREGTPLHDVHFGKKCGRRGLTSCELGLDAVVGKLPPDYTDALADLVRAKPSESGSPRFTYEVCDINTTVRPYTLGIDGIGLSRSSKHQPLLVDFVRDYGGLNFNDDSTQRRLARALFLSGKSSAAEAALRTMLELEPEARTYRPEVLKYLATWGAASAVDYCMDTLRSGKGPKEACIWYLGEMRHAEAHDLVVRRMEDEREAAARALGHLGDAHAVPVLEALLEKSKNPPLRTVSLVALINLGKSDLFAELERQLRGRILLSSGSESSRPKVDIMERAMLETLELHDPELRRRAFDYVESLGAPDENVSNGWRVPVVLAGVRAMNGDREAVEALAGMLDDPQKKVRHLVVELIGGDFERLTGTRVAERSLFDPLARAYEMEPDASAKREIVLAAAYLGAD